MAAVRFGIAKPNGLAGRLARDLDPLPLGGCGLFFVRLGRSWSRFNAGATLLTGTATCQFALWTSQRPLRIIRAIIIGLIILIWRPSLRWWRRYRVKIDTAVLLCWIQREALFLLPLRRIRPPVRV